MVAAGQSLSIHRHVKLVVRNCILLLAAYSMVAFSHDQESKVVHKLVIHPSSSLSINGKTNINKYRCAIDGYKGSDTLTLTAERGKGAYFIKGHVRLDASAFDCAKKIITNDFRETIQSEKYPNIGIRFISFEREPKYARTEEQFDGELIITLAQVSVPCKLRCGIVQDEHGLIHLRGKRAFKFSDFGLKPPTKMGGMIKVKEEIEVAFHLVFSRV
jgi:hypothetical protein